ncbi:gamma-mobile-trio protein GmtX [Acinetobacter sp. YH12039]|uniref:gamma-mobile-trio protein GmtX n=1 Tax=Acinetobacter sp. YH12039 TaxID=2601047 RepID=UPI0015D4051C|nr:gamma-mobile-trio protein GmtX [Acinetobacter sp. YH12039]
MSVDINLILENLKFGKSQRTQDSLDKLNILLETRFNAKEKDYSIATIGRTSKANGGISEVSIRNKTGEHFRILIEAWATKANTSMKKPPAPHSRKNEIPTDMELLKKLDDAVMRVVFGQIIAERNKLKAENRILKQNTEVVVDMRPMQNISSDQAHQGIQVLSALDNLLLPSEVDALKDAIDENKISQLGWTVSEYGAVKDEYERPLFKSGFVLAIQKILNQF